MWDFKHDCRKQTHFITHIQNIHTLVRYGTKYTIKFFVCWGSARLAQTYQAKRFIQNFDNEFEGLSEDLKQRVGLECELPAIVSHNSGEHNRARLRKSKLLDDSVGHIVFDYFTTVLVLMDRKVLCWICAELS